METYYGAASRAAQRELGGIFKPQYGVVPVGVAASKAVLANPNRIGLIIFNVGTTIVTLSPDPQLTAGLGLLLVSNGSSLALNWHDDADVVATEFYAIGNGAGGNIFVFEEVQASITPTE